MEVFCLTSAANVNVVIELEKQRIMLMLNAVHGVTAEQVFDICIHGNFSTMKNEDAITRPSYVCVCVYAFEY